MDYHALVRLGGSRGLGLENTAEKTLLELIHVSIVPELINIIKSSTSNPATDNALVHSPKVLLPVV
jgi:hypothetical protein